MSIYDEMEECERCWDRYAVAAPGELYACREHQVKLDAATEDALRQYGQNEMIGYDTGEKNDSTHI